MRQVEVTFLPEEESKTIRVMITDDANLEGLENFFGNLAISSDSASIAEVTVPQATVNITDNDGKHYKFSQLDPVPCPLYEYAELDRTHEERGKWTLAAWAHYCMTQAV